MTNLTSPTQGFEQTETLEAGGAVQTGSRLVEKHDWRIIDELQRYRQSLSLASAETLGLRVAGFAQTKRFDDLLDLYHVILDFRRIPRAIRVYLVRYVARKKIECKFIPRLSWRLR